MRINPVDHGFGFVSIHWPWWRTKFRAFLHRQHRRTDPVHDARRDSGLGVAEAGERVSPSGLDAPGEIWEPPAASESSPVDREWPSDQPPPARQEIDVRLNEEPRTHETGKYFDFFI